MITYADIEDTFHSTIKHHRNFKALIADWGTARRVTEPIYLTANDNPIWSAPEVIMRLPVTQTADTFSFALVMWEVLGPPKILDNYTKLKFDLV